MSTALRQPMEMPGFPPIRRRALETLQVNLGYRCNQACTHCHVDAGPNRTEAMDADTIALVLEFMRRQQPATLDVTGGAPELHPHFRDLVREARGIGTHVIDRCNLTVLDEAGQTGLADFLAHERVHVVASLPCYTADNVDRQRGRGVYARSLRGIAQLNALGYGHPGSELLLDFVYNPVGPFLPPDPVVLEADYRRELERLGIVFNRILTITNMPIARFRHDLERRGELDAYLTLLASAYAPENLDHVMCRTLLSVDWRGHVYDCDFNQMLRIPFADRGPTHLRDLLDVPLEGSRVAVRSHCFGCTAGRGSSCSGALRD